MDLSVKIGNTVFKNPVLTASGTFGYGPEFEDYLDLNKIGGFSTKGISLEPRGWKSCSEDCGDCFRNA